MNRASTSRSAAFTLIELLVVIAIISLLVSILLPALDRTKDLARQVACLTNLKTLGMAHFFYAEDNEETFAAGAARSWHIGSTPVGRDGVEWMPCLYAYQAPSIVGGPADTPYICPADVSPFETPERYADYPMPGDPWGYWTLVQFKQSYGVNAMVCPWLQSATIVDPSKRYVRLTQLVDPSTTALVTEATRYWLDNDLPGRVRRLHDQAPNMLYTDGRAMRYTGPIALYSDIFPDLRWLP